MFYGIFYGISRFLQKYTVKMPKLIVSLTDSKIKSAISMQKKSSEKNIKLSDGGGLYLLLDTKGGHIGDLIMLAQSLRKRATIAIGVIPKVHCIKHVQNEAEFREQLAQNIDPAIEEKTRS